MRMTGRDYMAVTPIRETECNLLPVENRKFWSEENYNESYIKNSI